MELKQYANIGLVHAMAYPEANSSEYEYLSTLEKTVEDEYFDIVEIIPPLNPGMDGTVSELVRSSGMDWVYCATPAQYGQKLDLNSFDPDARAHAIDVLKREIDYSNRLGIKKVQVCSGMQVAEIKKRAAARSVLAESLRALCAYAEPADVSLVLEIFDFEIEKKRFLGHSIDAELVAREVTAQHSNFGLLQDLSHIPIMYETPYPAVLTVAPHLVHTHIGNCIFRDRTHPRFGDTHPMFSVADSEVGVSELTAFLESLFAVDYLGAGKKGAVSFEIKTWKGENPNEIIANAKNTLRQAWEAMNV